MADILTAGDCLLQTNISGDVQLQTNISGEGVAMISRGGAPKLQQKTAEPTEQAQTIAPDENFDGLESVTVEAIPADYVGTSVPREQGRTITPDAIEQTAIIGGTYAEGSIIVDPVPGDWIGANIPMLMPEDLKVKGKTVTVPAGYYVPVPVSKSVETGSAAVDALSITADPALSVSSAGLVSASVSASGTASATVKEGYITKADTGKVTVSGSGTLQLPTEAGRIITPNSAQQTAILGGKYALGNITVDPVSDPYYDMSGALAWLGKDATLVYEITPITIALKNTDFNTWTPSTTAAVILASQTAGSYTATDMGTGAYNYLHLWEMNMPIEHTGTPTLKALPLLSAGRLVQVVFRRPSSWANVQAENYNSNVTAQSTLQSFLRYYGSTTGTKTYTWTASYGFYYTQTASTISSTTANSPTITLNTPTMTTRCSTTYMSTANAALIDKENTKLTIKCKVYRVRADSYLQGFYRWVIGYVKDFE